MRYTLLIVLVISMSSQAACSRLLGDMLSTSKVVGSVAEPIGRAGRVIDTQTLDLIADLGSTLNKTVGSTAMEVTVSLRTQKNLQGDELFIEATRQTAEQSIQDMAVLFRNNGIDPNEAIKHAEDVVIADSAKAVESVMIEQGEVMLGSDVDNWTQKVTTRINIKAIVWSTYTYKGNSDSE